MLGFVCSSRGTSNVETRRRVNCNNTSNAIFVRINLFGTCSASSKFERRGYYSVDTDSASLIIAREQSNGQRSVLRKSRARPIRPGPGRRPRTLGFCIRRGNQFRGIVRASRESSARPGGAIARPPDGESGIAGFAKRPEDYIRRFRFGRDGTSSFCRFASLSQLATGERVTLC